MIGMIRVLFQGKQKVNQNTSFCTIRILIARNIILIEKGNTTDTFLINSRNRLCVLNLSFKKALQGYLLFSVYSTFSVSSVGYYFPRTLLN